MNINNYKMNNMEIEIDNIKEQFRSKLSSEKNWTKDQIESYIQTRLAVRIFKINCEPKHAIANWNKIGMKI